MTSKSYTTHMYVIIPAYNASAYLNDLAESLSSQTYSGPKTAVFVNDGSSDNTLEVLESLVLEGFQKIVISNDHVGVSATRNAGLTWLRENADSGFALFLDADDMLENEALQIVAEQMQRENLDILAFGTKPFYESAELEKAFPSYKTYYQRKGDYPEVISGPEYLSKILDNNDFLASVCLQAFSVDFLKKNQLAFYPGIIHEDNLFTFEAILLAKAIRYINASLHIRRVRAGSIMTASAETASLDGYFRCAIEAIDFIKQNNLDNLSPVDCASMIDMWQNAAVDHYAVLDKKQIDELITRYTTVEQTLFAVLIQQRAEDRKRYEQQTAKAAIKIKADTEDEIRAKFENSASFKLGRTLTSIPRKLLGR